MLDLTATQLEAIRAVLRAWVPGREVRAFGSRVLGRARQYSDLDLMLMGGDPIADTVRAELREDFDESDLPFRVDIVLWRDAPAALRAAVEREGVMIEPYSEERQIPR